MEVQFTGNVDKCSRVASGGCHINTFQYKLHLISKILFYYRRYGVSQNWSQELMSVSPQQETGNVSCFHTH